MSIGISSTHTHRPLIDLAAPCEPENVPSARNLEPSNQPGRPTRFSKTTHPPLRRSPIARISPFIRTRLTLRLRILGKREDSIARSIKSHTKSWKGREHRPMQLIPSVLVDPFTTLLFPNSSLDLSYQGSESDRQSLEQVHMKPAETP